jgi:BlaI family penicillinase repressor
MGRHVSPRPTDAELAILTVLWKRGPSSVRDVYDDLNTARPMGYTTALKLLQIMLDKGLVLREESQRTHIYRAALAECDTQRLLVRDLLNRAFAGSARNLILQALDAAQASPSELAEIQKFIREYKRGES